MKAKVGVKEHNKWSYFLVRCDPEDLIREIEDLMHKNGVTQITIKFYEER